MRYLVKCFIIIVLVGFSGCEKQTENPAVEQYINQLKSGSYESYYLPAFKPSDIPELLNYCEVTTLISCFPRNGISSFRGPDCKLGMIVLWTIESIRAVETDTKYLNGRFPSRNPILALRDVSDFNLVFDEKSHKAASHAYYEWWYSSLPLKDKMKTDPLKGTDYKWH
jgi:hypothetical protein